MKGEELKQAFFDKKAVKFTIDSMPGIELQASHIDAIIYRHIAGSLIVSAELKDKNNNVPYIVPARCVTAL